MITMQASPIAISQTIASAKIHRTSSGQVLGAVLWIPGKILDSCVTPGQNEVSIAFEDNKMIIVAAAEEAEARPSEAGRNSERINEGELTYVSQRL
ncbi:hypothetical protein ANME2D_00549 [Candidatus Methanoperedens nitroreducens]|uniref:Uncharacterized protein n=2 Tax=Candidatus Methanoperedens nitratireducens TaxID=1392998 RepID=A0A062V346_9EURY|nr:hypothetical protein ANME2D_00549 [Candidatus Methanoperedens nitroreducens]